MTKVALHVIARVLFWVILTNNLLDLFILAGYQILVGPYPQCTPKLPLHPLTTLHPSFFMTISGCLGYHPLGNND